MKIKIKLNVRNLFQKIWKLYLDNQNVNNSLQNNMQHLKNGKNGMEIIFLNKSNNLLSYKSILSGIDPLLMME
jgi:hypothetical protein